MTIHAAHLGHISEVAGHQHWIAVGLAAFAGAVALYAWLTEPREDDEPSS